ncbi:protein enabled homolog isoform X1 [Alosa sapidissima]|uniref:protein enabled homolog isoform X1 n=1 Tax=Alosa sapidissima TaxID=34773 RepID=UPI001C09F997|nr:protein enabled homolog isoform X1 [Alosa sapidissima]
MTHVNSDSPAAKGKATSQVKSSAEDFGGDLTEFTSKFISAEDLERMHRSSEPHRLFTLSSPRLNLDLRAETLKVARDAATGQEQALKVAIESIRREMKQVMRSRQGERERKLAVLLEGRETRVMEVEKWRNEGKKHLSHQKREEGECLMLKDAIAQLPRVIHSLDRMRMVELEEWVKKEEEEDSLEWTTWREQVLHLDTITRQQSRDAVARVAQLWNTAENGGRQNISAATLALPSKLLPLPSQLPPLLSKLPPLPSQLPPLPSKLAPLPSKLPPLPSQLPPLPSKLAPLPSQLPPLPSKLAPLPSKLPPLPAKLPHLNPPLLRAFCNPVAPLPPIQCRRKQEDLDLESVSEHSTQSAVAEHLMVNLDADGQSPEATSTLSSESLAAGDSVVEQERKKTRSIKERFFQFLRKLNCCSAKED